MQIKRKWPFSASANDSRNHYQNEDPRLERSSRIEGEKSPAKSWHCKFLENIFIPPLPTTRKAEVPSYLSFHATGNQLVAGEPALPGGFGE
jgi:hypothetical protein